MGIEGRAERQDARCSGGRADNDPTTQTNTRKGRKEEDTHTGEREGQVEYKGRLFSTRPLSWTGGDWVSEEWRVGVGGEWMAVGGACAACVPDEYSTGVSRHPLMIPKKSSCAGAAAAAQPMSASRILSNAMRPSDLVSISASCSSVATCSSVSWPELIASRMK